MSRPVSIEKLAEGGMKVTYDDGSTGIIPAEDKEMMAFTVFAMLKAPKEAA